MYLATVPDLLKPLFGNDLLWKVESEEPDIYLTFDDGPVYEATVPILKILEQFNVKATFFCVGENVFNNHDLYLDILQRGHLTGNHTYNHLNGWKTPEKVYSDNVKLCSDLVNSSLFRPPYGRISRSQLFALKNHYTIVMWTLLAGDFDAKLQKEKCLERLITNLKPGSIIVLHDNLKTREMINFVLPRFLEHALGKSYKFRTLTLI